MATRQEETLYVQVAYLLTDEATHAREFGNLLDIPDNYPKLVVSMDPSSAQATRVSATSTSASSCRPSGDRSDVELGAETSYRGRCERLWRSIIRADAALASVSWTAPAPW